VLADAAGGMLRRARRHRPRFRRVARVAADAAQLPFAAARFDLVFCNLVLQWCPDPDAVFREVHRVLGERSLFLFSTFGPDTLKELRAAWAGVDEYSHVNRFIDMHDIGDALIRAGFAEPVMDVEHITMTYASVHDLMRDLKAVGAHNATASSPERIPRSARPSSPRESRMHSSGAVCGRR
jgi:malonyl-CoA O-methyltransferase